MATNLPFVRMFLEYLVVHFRIFPCFRREMGDFGNASSHEGPGLEDLTGLESSLALVISQKSFEHVQVRACSVDSVRTFPNVFPQPGDGNRMNQE